MAGFEDKNYYTFKAQAKRDITLTIRDRNNEYYDDIIEKGELISITAKRRDGSLLTLSYSGGTIRDSQLNTSYNYILKNCKDPNSKFLGIF